ncbi:MAG: HlyD family efflux transporter periplasmic adaptor subunit [Crocinitomicaceae bacterium]|nr:HlyD family efflux transporter periplasmic adaptor subunit [Crocinitomicaceae bacterium]MBK8927946.1 HlyD family efflux transporter periplasmic adaptor subunit [Crocinitomicaceae bacterium]
MLNISSNKIETKIKVGNYTALTNVLLRKKERALLRMLYIISAVLLIVIFLPWTQNIRSNGNVIALKPEQRPQTIHSVIGGRIEKWYVQEGQFVNKGDTIMYISEVKSEYFDTLLLERTQDQIDYKEQGVISYDNKIEALKQQLDALQRTSQLKQEQAKNKYKQAKLKVSSDSIKYQAAEVKYMTAEEQYKRFVKLYEDGIKSLTDVENRNLVMQNAMAEVISAENQLLTSQNELINAEVELFTVRANYEYEIYKTESEINSALYNKLDASAQVVKSENEFQNYQVRQQYYYITAPQDGYITRAIQSGIGEIVKEGTPLASIMPASYDLAVETYVRPMDLPLVEKGQKVRIQFDGWPSIVFSGWPNSSYGTFGGVIYAVDNFVSENGNYRVLVVPDPDDIAWPPALRPGSGAVSMMLLKDVPVWYEIWRKINGFPPDYYKSSENIKQEKK